MADIDISPEKVAHIIVLAREHGKVTLTRTIPTAFWKPAPTIRWRPNCAASLAS
jgi:hypothetical protein